MLIHLCGAKLSGCAAMNDTHPSFAHTTVGADRIRPQPYGTEWLGEQNSVQHTIQRTPPSVSPFGLTTPPEAEPRELRAAQLAHLNKSSGSHKTPAV